MGSFIKKIRLYRSTFKIVRDKKREKIAEAYITNLSTVSKVWTDLVENSVASSTQDGREDEDESVSETGEIEGNEPEAIEVDAKLATTLRPTAAVEAESPAKHAQRGTTGLLRAGHFNLKRDTKFKQATELLEDKSKTKRKMSTGYPGCHAFAMADEVEIRRTALKEPTGQ